MNPTSSPMINWRYNTVEQILKIQDLGLVWLQKGTYTHCTKKLKIRFTAEMGRNKTQRITSDSQLNQALTFSKSAVLSILLKMPAITWDLMENRTRTEFLCFRFRCVTREVNRTVVRIIIPFQAPIRNSFLVLWLGESSLLFPIEPGKSPGDFELICWISMPFFIPDRRSQVQVSYLTRQYLLNRVGICMWLCINVWYNWDSWSSDFRSCQCGFQSWDSRFHEMSVESTSHCKTHLRREKSCGMSLAGGRMASDRKL